MIRINQFPIYYKGQVKLLVKDKPIFWWVHKWTHFRFILRELTSLGVAFYSFGLIFYIRALKQGPESFADFSAWLESPWVIGIHMVAFLLVLYHSITWFRLAPKAMVIKLGKNRVPGSIITAMNYGAWLVISIALIFLFLNVDRL